MTSRVVGEYKPEDERKRVATALLTCYSDPTHVPAVTLVASVTAAVLGHCTTYLVNASRILERDAGNHNLKGIMRTRLWCTG